MNDISAIPAGGNAATTVSPEERKLNLSVSTAVRKLNDSGYAGDGREITFSIDRASQQPVITVIDSQTKQVIRQFPPKELLALADDTPTK
jgi:flagellar protein FlaG